MGFWCTDDTGSRPSEHTYLETYFVREFLNHERLKIIFIKTEEWWLAFVKSRFRLKIARVSDDMGQTQLSRWKGWIAKSEILSSVTRLTQMSQFSQDWYIFWNGGFSMLKLGKSQINRRLTVFCHQLARFCFCFVFLMSGCVFGSWRLVCQWPGLIYLDVAHLLCLCSSRSLIQETIKPERKVPPSWRPPVLNPDD